MFKVYVGSLYVPAKANERRGRVREGTAARPAQHAARRGRGPDDRSAGRRREPGEQPAAEARGREGADRSAGVDHESRSAQLKEGNVLTFDFVDGATKIGLNGAEKGSIPGEAFNKALTNAWLGDKPVQADLKKAMLGG